MIPVDITGAAAAQHRCDLQREAATSRLAALARCCSPRIWTRAGRRLAATVASGRHALQARRHPERACCA